MVTLMETNVCCCIFSCHCERLEMNEIWIVDELEDPFMTLLRKVSAGVAALAEAETCGATAI